MKFGGDPIRRRIRQNCQHCAQETAASDGMLRTLLRQYFPLESNKIMVTCPNKYSLALLHDKSNGTHRQRAHGTDTSAARQLSSLTSAWACPGQEKI